MKAKLRGTEIYFDVGGMHIAPHKNGFVERPVLFVLHGGPGQDHLRFKQHSLEFQEFAQVVYVDHRGCGRSLKTKAKDYTLKNNIEDIEALRKHLGLNKISILGTSYGGIVAQGYAIRYSKHLQKLILVATAPSYHFIDEAKNYLNQHGTPKQIAISQHLWNGSFKNHNHVVKFLEAMESFYSANPTKKKKPSGKIKTIWSADAINTGFGDFLRDFNFIPKLNKIKVPTLILAGKKDWICSPNQAKIIAAGIPHAKLKIFPKASHAIAVDAHHEYIRAVKRFMAD